MNDDELDQKDPLLEDEDVILRIPLDSEDVVDEEEKETDEDEEEEFM